jgi:hypothetical protein
VGLIKELVLLPVAPLRFTLWVSEKVADEADRQEAAAPAGIEQIDKIEEAREKGEVGEEEAQELEGRVIERQAVRAEPEKEGERG